MAGQYNNQNNNYPNNRQYPSRQQPLPQTRQQSAPMRTSNLPPRQQVYDIPPQVRAQARPVMYIVATAIITLVLTISSFFAGYMLRNTNVSASFDSLVAPTLALNQDSGTINFDKISGAKSYTVYVNNTESNNIVDNYASIKDLKDENGGVIVAQQQTYTIGVKAISANDNIKDSGFSNKVYYTNSGGGGSYDTTLSMPDNIYVSDKTLHWNDVPYANQYEVRSNGSSFGLVNNNFIDLSSISDYNTYKIDIQAQDNTGRYTSSDWATYSYTLTPPAATKLDTPINLSYDKDTHIASWNSVNNANSYIITLLNKATSQVSTFVTSSSVLNFELNAGGYSYTVVAQDTLGNYVSSDTSASFDFTVPEAQKPQLSAPTLSLNSDKTGVYWTSIVSSTGYLLDINGTTKTINATSYTFVSDELNAGMTYTIKVKALAGTDNTDSVYSNSVSFTAEQEKPATKPKLDTPVPYVVGTMLNYGSVKDALSYNISIDGQIQTTTALKYDLSGLTDNKTYIIKVRAIADSSINSDSDWSTELNYLPGSATLTGDTSPDAVQQRIEQQMPKELYESLFPLRFGSRDWKVYNYWYYADKMDTITEYYSYDNLIEAARLVASKILIIEYREGQGLAYTAQTRVIDKYTGEEMLIAPGTDFDAEWNVNKPIGRIQVDLGNFMLAQNSNDSKRDLAAFLANMAHETTGGLVGDGIHTSQFDSGLFFNEEVSYLGAEEQGVYGYISTENVNFPAYPNRSYHGRGPVQLSWNYNYGLISGILFGDKNVLLQEPSLVVTNDALGFATGLLFWMTPQPPKASCSDVITKRYTLTESDIAKGYELGFGLTIIIFNGGLEGNKTEEDAQIYDRVGHYRKIAAAWGLDITGEKLDTAGMGAWS